MSNIYTLIKRNIKDDTGDNIDLKIIFIKKNEIVRIIKAFDTKGRYFYVEYNWIPPKLKDFEYYKNTELNNIIYINFEQQLTIYLEGGCFSDISGLEEQKDSPIHLQTINKKITEVQNQLKKLEERKINTKILFDF
jgi:hypothetical protein